MKELIDFLLRETPGHAKEIQSDIGLLLSSLENAHSTIEGIMPSIDGDYAKIGEYYTMSRRLKKINDQISDLEKMFGICNVQEQDDDDELDSLEKGSSVNYSDYKVDESISHGLFENYTHKRPVAFSLDGNKYSVRDWKQVLRIVCEVLNQRDSKLFDYLLGIKICKGAREHILRIPMTACITGSEFLVAMFILKLIIMPMVYAQSLRIC